MKPVTTTALPTPAGCATTGFTSTSPAGPTCRRWMEEHGLNLGNSDEPAQHWLVADALTGDLYAAPTREASTVVRQQQLPGGA